MLAAVTGTPGMGKTLFSVRRIVDEICRGKVVATNVPMEPDFLLTIAKHRGRSFGSKKRQQRWADEASRRFFFSEDAAELMALRLRGKGESRGVMVLDEAHDWMNSRAWQADDRMEFVRWFSRHRKLGWDVYLVTQYLTNIDSQVRNLCEYHVTLLNLRNGLKVAGLPLCPVNVFLAVWRWNGGATAQHNVSKRNLNRLNPWIANLYDTYGGTGLADLPADPRYLLPLELTTAEDASVPGGLPAGADAYPPADGVTEELVLDARLGEIAAELLQLRDGGTEVPPPVLPDVLASCNPPVA